MILQDQNKSTCQNCKYLAWAIGVGAGLRCCYDMKATFQVPSSQHTCDKFKHKQDETTRSTTN